MREERAIERAFKLSRIPHLRDGLALSGLALLLFLILGQQALHGFDVYQLLRWVDQGVTEHPRHLLYLWVAGAWWGVLEPMGVPIYEALRGLSAVGAAVGVFLCHRAALGLGLDRVRAGMAGGLCASAPAVMHFATVVEIDGLFFACAALAWWALVSLAQTRSTGWAVATGGATAVAASMHAAGHLLVPVFGVFYLAMVGDSLKAASARIGTVVVTHVVLGALVLWILGPDRNQNQPVEGLPEMVTNTLNAVWGMKLWALPGIVWSEWILAFLPMSVLSFLALRIPGGKSLGRAFSVCVAGYLALTLVIFGQYLEESVYLPQGEMVERGSFLLGLCFPCAVLTARAVAPKIGAASIALAVVVGAVQIQINDRDLGDPELVAGAIALAEAEKVELILGDHEELDPMVKKAPWIPSFSVLAITVEIIAQPGVTYEQVTGFFDQWIALRKEEGRSVIITEGALRLMREGDDEMLERLAEEHFEEHYELEPVRSGGFEGFRLVRKS